MTIFAMFVASESKQTADSVCLPITQCSKRINLSNSAINIVTLNYPYIRLDPALAPAPAKTSTKDEIRSDVVKLKRLHQENWYKQTDSNADWNLIWWCVARAQIFHLDWALLTWSRQLIAHVTLWLSWFFLLMFLANIY